MQHMLSIHMSIISTEKERSQRAFQRHTSFCSNEQATEALNVTQLGSTEDLSLFAPTEIQMLNRLLMVASKFMKELQNKKPLLLLLHTCKIYERLLLIKIILTDLNIKNSQRQSVECLIIC